MKELKATSNFEVKQAEPITGEVKHLLWQDTILAGTVKASIFARRLVSQVTLPVIHCSQQLLQGSSKLALMSS